MIKKKNTNHTEKKPSEFHKSSVFDGSIFVFHVFIVNQMMNEVQKQSSQVNLQ